MPLQIASWALDRYSQLSKAAFDSYHSATLKQEGGPPSFQAGVVSVLKAAGIPDEYLHGISGEQVGSQDWMATFRKFASAAGDFVTDKAVGLFVGATLGPEFSPAAMTAVSTMRGSYRAATAAKQRNKALLLKAGQWVYINNERVPGYDPGWKESTRRRLKIEPEPADKVSVGFYVAMSTEPGNVNVFNFDVYREQQVPIDDVYEVPKARAQEFDRNAVMSEIRDLKFARPPSTKMDSNVPTDPGTEVVYQDLLYHIVKSESGRAIIEDEFGQRRFVSIEKLQPGRVLHTNSWNYRRGKPFMGGFETESRASFYHGQWIWVKAREAFLNSGTTTHELAVVWKIQGNQLHAILAMDGKERTVSQQKAWPISDRLSETLNMEKRILKFRMEACEGGDTETYNLGQYDDLLLTVTGQTYEAQAQLPKEETPGEIVAPVETATGETVGGQGDKEAVDAKVEVARATGVAPGKIATEEDMYMYENADSRQDDSLFAYGVMLAAGLFLYNAVDINLDVLSAF